MGTRFACLLFICLVCWSLLLYFQSLDPQPVCTWRFQNYSASQWEFEWSRDILRRQDNVSDFLFNDREKSLRFVRTNWYLLTQDSVGKVAEEDLSLFSEMHYKLRCGNADYHGVQLIEPLIGMLRDPLFLVRQPMPHFDTPGVDPVQSKRFLLPALQAPFKMIAGSAKHVTWLLKQGPAPWVASPGSRTILFDLGSSYYGSWAGNSEALGTKWFVHLLHNRGLIFHRIFAFEYTKLDPYQLWEDVPSELMSVYSPINHGVEAAPDSKFNPWNLIKAVCTQTDFVIVKLDIDNVVLESVLMAQLRRDKFLLSLVDEMFFEHHTDIPEMNGFWGKQNAMEKLADSYQLFTELRAAGIRMHSWP